MYRLNRLNSINQLVPLFTAPVAATYRKRLFRLNPPIRSFSFTHSSCRRVRDPPSPAATAGIDDLVNVGEEGKISGEDLPENESSGGLIFAEDSNASNNTYERKVLPPELSRSVVMLACESSIDGGFCDVYLVGTAHVSTKSCQEVKAVIEFLKPQVVFIELCSSRIDALIPQNVEMPTMGDMMDMWNKNEDPFGIFYTWFLAKVASKLEVLPGAEFHVAYEEATKYGGKVILGDRPVEITMRRTWAKMSLWQKTKLMSMGLFQTVCLLSPEYVTKKLKEMDDANMLTLVIQEMSKSFPTLMETLVHERDRYMSATLLRVAREHSSVVAVVGKGHLVGIQKNWKQPVNLNQLLSMPSEKKRIPVGKILTSIGATVAIISGIYLSIKK